MLDIYCDQLYELKRFLAELVHFGIIKEEDAHCFVVESKLKSGFFLMCAGALLLALLNTFVSQAALQYLRDRSEPKKLPSVAAIHDQQQDQISVEQAKDIIEPTPVLFTDRFRWCLLRQDAPKNYMVLWSASSVEEGKKIEPEENFKNVSEVESENPWTAVENSADYDRNFNVNEWIAGADTSVNQNTALDVPNLATSTVSSEEDETNRWQERDELQFPHPSTNVVLASPSGISRVDSKDDFDHLYAFNELPSYNSSHLGVSANSNEDEDLNGLDELPFYHSSRLGESVDDDFISKTEEKYHFKNSL